MAISPLLATRLAYYHPEIKAEHEKQIQKKCSTNKQTSTRIDSSAFETPVISKHALTKGELISLSFAVSD